MKNYLSLFHNMKLFNFFLTAILPQTFLSLLMATITVNGLTVYGQDLENKSISLARFMKVSGLMI